MAFNKKKNKFLYINRKKRLFKKKPKPFPATYKNLVNQLYSFSLTEDKILLWFLSITLSSYRNVVSGTAQFYQSIHNMSFIHEMTASVQVTLYDSSRADNIKELHTEGRWDFK